MRTCEKWAQLWSPDLRAAPPPHPEEPGQEVWRYLQVVGTPGPRENGTACQKNAALLIGIWVGRLRTAIFALELCKALRERLKRRQPSRRDTSSPGTPTLLDRQSCCRKLGAGEQTQQRPSRGSGSADPASEDEEEPKAE